MVDIVPYSSILPVHPRLYKRHDILIVKVEWSTLIPSLSYLI